MTLCDPYTRGRRRPCITERQRSAVLGAHTGSLGPTAHLTGAHFVRVMSDSVSYVQVTGNGDFTKINIPAGDDGGELDVRIIFPLVF